MRNGKKGVIVWSSVGGFLIILFLIITLVTMVIMPDVLSSVLGRDKAVFVKGVEPLYESEYDSKEAV